MYAIYAYIGVVSEVNVGIYAIRGVFGICLISLFHSPRSSLASVLRSRARRAPEKINR